MRAMDAAEPERIFFSLKTNITKVLLKYGRPIPKKRQVSPHKHREIIYGAKEQLTPEDDTSPPQNSQGTKCVQSIVGALLYYARAVDNKLLFGLALSVHSRLLPHSAQMKPSTKFWITAPLSLLTTLSIAPATWSSAHILTQDSTMRAMDAAEPERIFFSLKTMPCPDGTGCTHNCKNHQICHVLFF